MNLLCVRNMVRILFALVLVFFITFGYVANAQELTPTPTQQSSSEKLNDLRKKITDLQNKISELQTKEKSLSSEIALMDNQIRLTQLRINATQQELSELTRDIAAAKKRIEDLEFSLNIITKLLVNRVIVTYQVGSIEPLQILITSGDPSNFLSRLSYLKIVQEHDKKLVYSTSQAKNDYENQKKIFEGKKKQAETLKAQLEGYHTQLNEEKATKDELLRITKNSESEYQRQLSAAITERSAIEGVVSSLKLEDGTPVREGQIIAGVGNTGYPSCSTGPHLHFEIRVHGAISDPATYLKPGVSWEYSYDPSLYSLYGTIDPRGDWNWPLLETIRINQGYGSHGYSSRYPGGIHTGIDMESSSSIAIKAPKDGTLYKGTTACGSSPLKFVAVDHGDGIISWYWHVQ